MLPLKCAISVFGKYPVSISYHCKKKKKALRYFNQKNPVTPPCCVSGLHKESRLILTQQCPLHIYVVMDTNTHTTRWRREFWFLPEFGCNDDCCQDEQRGDGHGDIELWVHCNTHIYTHTHEVIHLRLFSCSQNKRRKQCSQLKHQIGRARL